MKKIILLGFTLLTGVAYSQEELTEQEILNAEPCYSHKFIEYQEQQYPGFSEHVDNEFLKAKNHNFTKGGNGDPYVIPVVVHIVHNPNHPEQNLHDSIVENQIDILNADFMRWNEDTVNLREEFLPIVGGSNIRFRLATIDPEGNPSSGIVRTETSKSTFGDLSILTQGNLSSVEAVKSSATDGVDPWDQSRYLNIWVCNIEISGFTPLLGYATPPANLPNWPGGIGNMSDGVVIQYQALGSNNPNDLLLGGASHEVLGRTATHEVGHYLGLRHIWADGGCNQQDGIDDTPNALQQSAGCDTSANTCIDDILGMDLPDMIENYMDYSDETCQNSFTKGQAELMHGVLENQRYDLVYNNPASVDKNELKASIFPNPAHEELNIKVDNGKIKRIEVVNLSGQRLILNQPNSNIVKLNISDLTKGIYFAKIMHNNGLQVMKKFVVL